MAIRERDTPAIAIAGGPRSDRGFWLRWTAVATALLVFPFAFLALLHPAGLAYTGMLFSPSDNIVYTTQMLHASTGDWLWRDWFTYVPEAPRPIYMFFTALGKLQPPVAGPVFPAIIQHLARMVLALLFLDQAWRFFGEVLPSRAARRVAFIFLVFTAGLGVFVLLTIRPTDPPFDLFYPQSSAFYGLLYPPQFAAMLLLAVVFLRCARRAFEPGPGGWRAAILGSLAIGVASTIHPDTAAALMLGAGLYCLWQLWLRGPRALRRWSTSLRGILLVGGGIPYIAYTLVALGHDALLANGLVGATPPTIPILYYSLGFGIPGLCALATLRRVRALRHAPAAMVLLWSLVAANVLLLATRVGQNGHGGEGMGLALSPLAAWALVHEILPRFWRTGAFRAAVRRRLFGYSRPRLRLLSLNLVLILSSPSVLALAFATPRAGLASAGEIYMTGDDLAATAWIRGNVGSDDIVVAAPESAQLVAAYGGARVAFGTRYYTPDYDGEATRLLAFFREPATSQRYLAERSVGWVYFGPREAGVATYDPASMPYLVAAYTTGRTTIYRVRT